MPSIEIKAGARSVTFYPLNLKAIRELQREIEFMMGMDAKAAMQPESLDRLEKVFLLSAKRGNPDITVDDIREIIDTENMLEIVYGIMGQSGYKRVAAGGPAVAPTSPRIGGNSTPASPETQDGPTEQSTS